MTAYVAGPAILLTARDATALDRSLRDAIRLGYVVRGLPVPRPLLRLADQVHALSREFRVSAEVSGVRETTSAKQGLALSPSAETDQLSAEQAAAIMGITPQHVRALARKGAITASRAGSGTGAAWAIDAASALAWTEGRRQAQRTRRAA